MQEMAQIWPNYGGGADWRTLADITLGQPAACAPLLKADEGVLENPQTTDTLLSDAPS